MSSIQDIQTDCRSVRTYAFLIGSGTNENGINLEGIGQVLTSQGIPKLHVVGKDKQTWFPAENLYQYTKISLLGMDARSDRLLYGHWLPEAYSILDFLQGRLSVNKPIDLVSELALDKESIS